MGLSEEEIARAARPPLDGWAEPDAVLVRMVDELQAADIVSEPTWAALARRWSEPELLELLALAGFYRMTAGLLNSAGVEAEPGVPGWPPGTAPGR